MDLSSFERKIGVKFQNSALLVNAFTHRSFINENRKGGREHNERLEFLGDAVLELVVTDFLFRKYPSRNEGEMTSLRSGLVNAATLSELAGRLGLNDHLLLSRGEAKDMGRARQYILANTFEALVGAIYLDCGYDAVEKFIARYLLPMAEEIVKSGGWMDAKSFFQERAQEVVGVTPNYKTLSEEGPDHDKEFTVGVFLGSEKVAVGVGRSKQDAEQAAASAGLKAKNWK